MAAEENSLVEALQSVDGKSPVKNEIPGESKHSLLSTEDSYEELEPERVRHPSGLIAEIVEGAVHTEEESNHEDHTDINTIKTNHIPTPEESRLHDNAVFTNEQTTDADEEQRLRSGSVLEKVDTAVRENLEEDIHSSQWKQHRKHIFILSEAGKPIYTRYGNEDKLVTLMGVIQALVSFVQDEKNSLRSIIAGNHLIVFMVRSPLILAAASSTRESQQQVLLQLTYMYNQIISVLTFNQLNRIFESRRNYDLRRLLHGTEKFLDNLANLMDNDPCFMLSAVRGLPLESSIRESIGYTMHSIKVKDLVFAILIADNQLVTLVRMKKYVLHPADLHLIINLLNASTAFQNSDSWIPLCLPKFDSTGYLHAHISYLDDSPACLLLLTVDHMAFKEMDDCKQKILEKLRKSNSIAAIKKSVKNGSYTCEEVGVSDLRHFLYKARSTAQFTAPAYSPPYKDKEQQERLLSLYQYIHQRIHNPARPLKILFHVGPNESILGWVTSGFELYAVFSPLTTKHVAILAVNKVLKWIKKEEERLFILNPPEF